MADTGLLRHVAHHDKIVVTDPRLEEALQPHFFVIALRIVDRDRMKAVQPTHLTWLLEQERAGTLFLSGKASFAQGDSAPDRQFNGFVAVRAATVEAAAAIADGEPFIAAGIMTYELYEWTVFQGALAVSIRLSAGTGDFS